MVGGRGPFEGRVEVFQNGTWGRVCGYSWDLKDAKVVCRELGFPGDHAAYRQAFFGKGNGPIWMDNVRCTGNEISLAECTHRGYWRGNDCHYEDASVMCYGGD